MTLIGLSYSEIFAGMLGMLLIAILAGVGVLASRHARAARVVDHPPPPRLIPKLTSEALANLIVQALVDSRIVPGDKFEDAAQVAARKIDLRTALGDY